MKEMEGEGKGEEVVEGTVGAALENLPAEAGILTVPFSGGATGNKSGIIL